MGCLKHTGTNDHVNKKYEENISSIGNKFFLFNTLLSFFLIISLTIYSKCEIIFYQNLFFGFVLNESFPHISYPYILLHLKCVSSASIRNDFSYILCQTIKVLCLFYFLGRKFNPLWLHFSFDSCK